MVDSKYQQCLLGPIYAKVGDFTEVGETNVGPSESYSASQQGGVKI